MRALLLLIMLCFPTLALAGIFSVDPSDKSMQYLGMVFGSVPGLPIQNTGNPLFAQMVYIFNQIIFALGLIIVVYTTLVGTMNTAQEGEFLGKNWHPILVPLRAALGTYLLLPTVNSYNWIQITVMWFIVQGVGAANALWSQVISYNQAQGNIHQTASTTSLNNAMSTVVAIFTNDVCMQKINSDPTAILLKGPITYYRSGDQIQWGVAGDSLLGKTPLCGSVTLPKVGGSGLGTSNATNEEANKDIFAAAILSAAFTLSNDATNALANNTTSSNNFLAAAQILQIAAGDTKPNQDLNDINQQAVTDGWIHAGSYYFNLTQNSGVISRPVMLTTNGMDTSGMDEAYGSTLSSKLQSAINSVSTDYSNNATDDATPPSSKTGSLQLSNYSGDEHTGSIMASIFGGLFESLLENLTNQMTTGGANDDPLISMAAFGSALSTITEQTFWIALGIVFALWLVTSICSCMQPLGQSMNFLISMFMPIASLMIALLWAEGIMLGFYVPLIPYLVFSFSALTWMVLVIEAMLGSPLIALSLVVPSEEEIGKAGYAMVILLGLFLRPALMVVGFVLAIQLLMIGVSMLNFTFWPTLRNNTGAAQGIGFFGLIAVIFIYASIAIGMVHEAFSLIYVLPNKVLRWMGGGPEEDSAGEKAKELKGSVEKGTAIGKGLMSSTLSRFAPKGGGK